MVRRVSSSGGATRRVIYAKKLSGEGSGEGGKTRLGRISPVGLSTSARLGKSWLGK